MERLVTLARAGAESRRSRALWMPLGVLVILLGLVGVAFGGYLLSTARATHAVEVDGTIADYREITINGSYARNELKLTGDSHTYIINRSQFHPGLPVRFLQAGKAQVWINEGTNNVLALTLYDELGLNPIAYTTDAYDHPVRTLYATETTGAIAAGGGGLLALIALLWLLVAARAQNRSRRAPRGIPQPATVREAPQPAFDPRAGRVPAIPAARPATLAGAPSTLTAAALASDQIEPPRQPAPSGSSGQPRPAALRPQPSAPRGSLAPNPAPVPWPAPTSGPFTPQPAANSGPYAPSAPPTTSGPFVSQTPPPGAAFGPRIPPASGASAEGASATSDPFAPQPPPPGSPSYPPQPGATSGPFTPAPQPTAPTPPPATPPEPPMRRFPVPTPAQAAPTMPAPQRSQPLAPASGGPGAGTPGTHVPAESATPPIPSGWADGFAAPQTSMRPPSLRPLSQPIEPPAAAPAPPRADEPGEIADLPTTRTPSVAPPPDDVSELPTQHTPAAPPPMLDDDGGRR